MVALWFFIGISIVPKKHTSNSEGLCVVSKKKGLIREEDDQAQLSLNPEEFWEEQYKRVDAGAAQLRPSAAIPCIAHIESFCNGIREKYF